MEHIDPYETALGKAYLHLFNKIDEALDLLTQEKRLEGELLLMKAQRTTEEMLTDRHPLQSYTAP